MMQRRLEAPGYTKIPSVLSQFQAFVRMAAKARDAHRRGSSMATELCWWIPPSEAADIASQARSSRLCLQDFAPLAEN